MTAFSIRTLARRLLVPKSGQDGDIRPAGTRRTDAAEAAERKINAPGGFAVLRRHRAIGWDMDGTLIGHDAAPLLHDFIRSHPELRHVIVTFRSHGLETMLWRDLAAYATAPAPACFEAVINMDDDIFASFQRWRRWRDAGRHAGPPAPVEERYLAWKGRLCAERGLTVLVDDMTEHVRPGCARHDVALLHPDDFL